MSSSSQVLTQTIQDAVLKLCTQQLSFCKSLEIDGIICISQGEDIAKDIIVKMHRTVFKSAESQPLGYEIDGGSHYEPSQTFSLLEDGVICEEPPRDITPLSSFNTSPQKLQGKKTRKRSLDDETASSSKQHKKLDSVVIKIETEDSITLDSADVGDNEDNYDDSSNWANEEDTTEYKDAPKDKTVSTKDPDDDLATQDNPDFGDSNPEFCHNNFPSHDMSELSGFTKTEQNDENNYFNTMTEEMHVKTENNESGTLNLEDKSISDYQNGFPDNRYTQLRYLCPWCNQRCQNTWCLKRHIRKHTGEKPFTCAHCQKDFSDKGNMLKHVRAKHDNNQLNIPSYPCSECWKSFPSVYALERHKRSHTGEKPFACDQCPRRFSDKGNMKKHRKKIHQPVLDKEYQCEYCSKQFNILGSLKRHLLVHSNERPHICSLCQAAFKDRGNLLKHLQTKHAKCE